MSIKFIIVPMLFIRGLIMDQNLKNDIEECLVCADEIEAYGIIKDRMTTTFRENVRYEMLKLLAYIGYGNGFFSGQEIDFIKEATGFNVTEGMLRSIVASEHLQESSYKDNPPFAMKYFILSDAGGKAKDNKRRTPKYINVMRNLGQELIARDGTTGDALIDRLTGYIGMLEKNAKEYGLVNVKGTVKETNTEKKTVEEALEELNSLTGLDDVKRDVNTLVNLMKVQKIREERGMKVPTVSKHLVFSGNPGTGKTTIAKVIANTTSADFTQINATVAGKKDMEDVVAKAKDTMGMYQKKTILFIDEIHRFNKGQQDYLLPFVEDGTLVLIGATTENPYFEVNGALISRSIIFELKPLEKEDIEKLLERAVTDPVKGLGTYNVVLDADAKEFLADIAGGDARAALNAIELGVLSTERQADGKIHIDLETASECIQKRVVRYDKTGDQHYDTISAFIKSMRGSDPDAAVFYLAKMLYAGEDIKFIARRIMICAAEDVGLADPNALNVAVSASLAVERVGMPEAQIILAEAATYVACASKSNSSYEAVFAAMKTVGSVRTSVPPHLQDAHYKGSAKLGHGEGYQYAHDYPNHYVEQQYLPDEILGSRFLHLGTNGYEQKIRENFKKIGKDIE